MIQMITRSSSVKLETVILDELDKQCISKAQFLMTATKRVCLKPICKMRNG